MPPAMQSCCTSIRWVQHEIVFFKHHHLVYNHQIDYLTIILAKLLYTCFKKYWKGVKKITLSKLLELLNMSRQQISVVIGLLTGHLGLNGHLHKIGKDINPLCRRCLNGNEMLNTCYVNVNPWQCHGVAFLDKVSESFNSHMSQWTYFDGLPEK